VLVGCEQPQPLVGLDEIPVRQTLAGRSCKLDAAAIDAIAAAFGIVRKGIDREIVGADPDLIGEVVPLESPVGENDPVTF
jgi:hypothetical protein